MKLNRLSVGQLPNLNNEDPQALIQGLKTHTSAGRAVKREHEVCALPVFPGGQADRSVVQMPSSGDEHIPGQPTAQLLLGPLHSA